MTEPARIVTCPTCRRALAWTESNAFRPFCSERCRLIDLGEWAGEGRRIAGEPTLDEASDPEDPDPS
jgi:uncharacterized protein